jgi:hypothetical protein
MKGRRLVLTAVATTAFFSLLPASFGTAKRAGVKTHDVNMFLAPAAQDVNPGPIVVDQFSTEGPPFGYETFNTFTPRSQTGGLIRSGEWEVLINSGQQNQGACFGTFRIERNVIETTDDYQRVDYGGNLRIKGCRKAKEFKNVRPGKLGTLTGRTICTLRRCKGTLWIEGEIRY